MGLERRTARHAASDFRHHDGLVLRERKARARPLSGALDGGAIFKLVGKA